MSKPRKVRRINIQLVVEYLPTWIEAYRLPEILYAHHTYVMILCKSSASATDSGPSEQVPRKEQRYDIISVLEVASIEGEREYRLEYYVRYILIVSHYRRDGISGLRTSLQLEIDRMEIVRPVSVVKVYRLLYEQVELVLRHLERNQRVAVVCFDVLIKGRVILVRSVRGRSACRRRPSEYDGRRISGHLYIRILAGGLRNKVYAVGSILPCLGYPLRLRHVYGVDYIIRVHASGERNGRLPGCGLYNERLSVKVDAFIDSLVPYEHRRGITVFIHYGSLFHCEVYGSYIRRSGAVGIKEGAYKEVGTVERGRGYFFSESGTVVGLAEGSVRSPP